MLEFEKFDANGIGDALKTFATDDRRAWRQYLQEHYKTDTEVWFVFPSKASGEASLSYNDVVEEALCFGWIDSVIKRQDENHRIQRFTPRRENSPYSQPNIERLRWCDEHGMLMPEVKEKVESIISEPFVFPDDIIAAIKADPTAWENYQGFSDSYKRIRVAYIEAARKKPEEFEKRLANFIDKTRKNKLIRGYGGVEKYYGIIS